MADKITYEEFLKVLDCAPFHSEIEFFFKGIEKSYMLIKYEENLSFCRCGYDAHEEYYDNFEELSSARLIDNICLKDCWDIIEVIDVNFTYVLPSMLDDMYIDEYQLQVIKRIRIL